MKKLMRMFFLLAGILILVLGTVVPAFAYKNGEEIPPEKVAEVQREIDASNAAEKARLEAGREKFDRENRIVTGTDGVRRKLPDPVETMDADTTAWVKANNEAVDARMAEGKAREEEWKRTNKGQLQLTNGQVVEFDLPPFESGEVLGETNESGEFSITTEGVTYLETPQGFVAQTTEPKIGGNSYETQGAVRPKFGTKILPTPKTLSGNPVGLSDMWEADKENKAETPIIEEKSAVIPLEENNELPKVLISH
jgi:hypothetical protein